MRSCKFYSAYKVPGVPQNSLKLRNAIKQVGPLMVPSPSHVVHPFYTPSTTEEIIACSTEVLPALLDGKPIVPALVKDSVGSAYHLEMSSLKFSCVRGVSSWLEELGKIRCSSLQSDYKVLDDRVSSLKPSKLNRINHPLISNLKQLFAVSNSHQINTGTLDSIIEQFVNDRNLGIFSEDVYLYLLQHHVNSTEKILAIIESIKLHLTTDIDQLKVIEELVLQILISLKKNELPITPQLVTSFDGLIEDINSRFHLQNCLTQFQPTVCEAIFGHYINVGNLSESKRTLSGLIARKFLPGENKIVGYLKLVNEQLALNKTHRGYLRAFALVADLRPIIERARNPLIFIYLIPLCRHMSEVTSLLGMIKKSKNVKEVLDINLIPFINRINHLKSESSLKSANLCSLYRMASPFYDNKLSDKFSKAFILSFADVQNYSMMATILMRDTVVMSNDFFSTLLSKLEKNSARRESQFTERCEAFKAEFFRNHMIPCYLGLPLKFKLQVVSQINTESTLSAVLEAEIFLSQNPQLDALKKILKRGFKNDLLSDLPEPLWIRIKENSELDSLVRQFHPKEIAEKVQFTKAI